jgi:hypothetical protein
MKNMQHISHYTNHRLSRRSTMVVRRNDPLSEDIHIFWGQFIIIYAKDGLRNRAAHMVA